jgi:transcriptional regulator of arginine metabolism
MKGKAARQHTLRLVIDTGAIETQDRLVEEMKTRGFSVTQATLSRDLTEMGIGKARGANGKLRYSPEPATAGGWPVLLKMADAFVINARHAGNLAVLRTMPGYAQGVAGAVDSLADPVLLGTIAGDDTILVVAADERAAQGFIERLQKEG